MNHIRTIAALTAATLTLALADPAQAAPGGADTTFSGDGRLVIDVPGGAEDAAAVVVQPDGKLVIVGESSSSGGRMVVVRLQPNGSPDTSFSGDGRAFVDFGPAWDNANDVALQPDGRIVLAGSAGDAARTAIARLNPNGSLDTSFSQDGKVTVDLGPSREFGDEVELQDDGRVVVTGSGNNRISLVRLTANGGLDPTFSGDGIVRTDLGVGPEQGWGLDIRPDGRLLVTGTAGAEGTEQTPVLRYLPDGSLDPTFSDNGWLKLNTSPGYEDATSIVALDDDRILIAGDANGRLSLVRFQADGAFDTTFSGDGRQLVDLAGYYEYLSVAAVQPDGRIVTSGYASGQGGRILVARWLDDGALDPSFSGDGWATLNVSPEAEFGWGLALQADGRIVVAGSTGDINRKILVARFLAA